MRGIDKFYLNKSIAVLLRVNDFLKQMEINELLNRTRYGKTDTIGFDSFAETTIAAGLESVDPEIILLTEENDQAGKRFIKIHSDDSFPTVFIADPIDRSYYLRTFFEKAKKRTKLKDLLNQKDIIQRWEEHAGRPAVISGGTSAISGIKNGTPFFSVILNFITQDLFVACELGNRKFNIKNLPKEEFKWVTIEKIFKEGEKIKFDLKRDWDNFREYKNFVTFTGKKGYKENLRDTQIFSQDPEKHLVYKEPGGATRILYLSSLYEHKMGFVLSNGEKIIEWVHWLPFIMAANQTERECLKIFEIYFERPNTRDGILTATNPAYSIFNSESGRHTLNFGKIKHHPKPARFRSTLLITPKNNLLISSVMKAFKYRGIKLSF